MRITRDEEKKTISFWLTRAESENVELRDKLKPWYREFRDMGYFVVVYSSGTKDLYEGTRDLLIHNLRRKAALDVRRHAIQNRGDIQ